MINGTASDVTNNTRFISVTPKSDTLFTNTLRIFESLRLSRCTGIRPIYAHTRKSLRFLSQCIFESLQLSRCTGIRPIYAHTRKYAVLSFAVHLENHWFSRCTGPFALSADRNTRYFVQAQYRAFLSAALLIAYAHYTTLWGSRKYLKCLIQTPYFAAVFVETTLLIRFIFQADSVCNQCYKF